MTVSHNHFYWGHGMSIGSETDGGVEQEFASSISPSTAPTTESASRATVRAVDSQHDVVYDDVCIRNSPNPIVLDTGLFTAAGTVKGNSPPTMRDITLHNVRISGGGKFSFNGYDQDPSGSGPFSMACRSPIRQPTPIKSFTRT
jgi:polygalacturonase